MKPEMIGPCYDFRNEENSRRNGQQYKMAIEA
jgi:hypothetical protein